MRWWCALLGHYGFGMPFLLASRGSSSRCPDGHSEGAKLSPRGVSNGHVPAGGCLAVSLHKVFFDFSAKLNKK